MGYEGECLGNNGKGINNPIMVKETPRYEGLGYGHREFIECSKLFEAKKSSDDDMSHQDGSDNGNLSPKRYESIKVLFMSSSSPHHQSYSPRDKYKFHGNFLNVGNFDYLWDMYSFTFCNVVEYCVVDCEKHKVMVKRMDQIHGINRVKPPLSLNTFLLM